MSIVGWPSAAPVAGDSSRSTRLVGWPSPANDSNGNYMTIPAAGGLSLAATVGYKGAGGFGTFSFAGSPSGQVVLYRGTGGGGNMAGMFQAPMTQFPRGLNVIGGRTNAFGELWIFRELIEFVGDAPTGVLLCGHGVYIGSNTGLNVGWGAPGQIRTGTAFAGFLLVRDSLDVYNVLVRTPTTTLITPLSVNLTNVRGLVEHRLYQATAARVGRYELWVNEARVYTIEADDPNFPNIGAGSVGNYMPMPIAKDNYNGSSAGLYVYGGELIIGKDTAETTAY